MTTMLYRSFRLRFALSLFAVLLLSPSSPALAQQSPQQSQEKPPESRNGRTYFGVLGTALEYRKIGGANGEEAWGTIGTLVLGTHISDLFHVELRAGRDITETEVTSDLTIELDYYISWYMGLHYDLTDYANVYVQAGFSHFSGNAKLSNPGNPENRRFQSFTESEFPESSFAFSWLVGADYEVLDNTYFVLEGGRLYEDTETLTQAFQFNSGIRYEF